MSRISPDISDQLLFFSSFESDWTVRLLMLNGKLAGRSTYQDLMEFAFGRPGLIAISIFQFAFAFGGNERLDIGKQVKLETNA